MWIETHVPGLIHRFVDSDAEFIFVPGKMVMEVAKNESAIPFDIEGAELMHYMDNGEERVTFDAIIRKYSLKDDALLELARIVRGADASIPDAPVESAGLEAAALGFRKISRDDHENMKLQFPLYDALYQYVRNRLEQGIHLEHSR